MGPLPGFLRRNWTLKLSAFGIALLVWFAVRVEAPNRQEVTGVPVRVDLRDPRWALAGEPVPTSVAVRFAGPSRELLRMVVDRPSVVIPLDDVGAEDTTVMLRNQHVRLQDRPGVVVENIRPSSVRLSLEPVEGVVLPVTLRFTGDLPPDLAMAARPVVDPDEIRITGPRSRLQGLDSVPLVPVPLDEVTASGNFPVPVDTTRIRVQRLQLQPRTVRVSLLVEDRVERMVSGIPVVLPEGLRGQEDLEILPATGAVLLRGARSVVDGVDPTTLELVIRADANTLPEAGEEAEFPLALAGLPELLEGEPPEERAVVRRLGNPSP